MLRRDGVLSFYFGPSQNCLRLDGTGHVKFVVRRHSQNYFPSTRDSLAVSSIGIIVSVDIAPILKGEKLATPGSILTRTKLFVQN